MEAQRRRGTRAVQHISQEEAWAWVLLRPEYQKERKKKKKKKKHPQKKESSRERRKKALPYAFIGDCMLFVVTQNFRGHWFSRKWIWGAIFFHFTFSSVCLKSGYWNPSSATLFSAHLEAIQAPLLNICRLQTLFFPLSPLDQSLLYSTRPLFWARVSLLSPGFALHPSFLLTPCPWSDFSFTPCVGEG